MREETGKKEWSLLVEVCFGRCSINLFKIEAFAKDSSSVLV